MFFGYGMLLGPFIPMWYAGEEFNNPFDLRLAPGEPWPLDALRPLGSP